MYSYKDMVLLHNGPVTEQYMQFVHYVLRLQEKLIELGVYKYDKSNFI